MYEADLTDMSLDEIVEVLTGLRHRFEHSPWRVEDAELVVEIREELILRGYPESLVDPIWAFSTPEVRASA